jgi:hypothetical protein
MGLKSRSDQKISYPASFHLPPKWGEVGDELLVVRPLEPGAVDQDLFFSRN